MIAPRWVLDEVVVVMKQLAASHFSESDLAKWLGDLSQPFNTK
jgi:hypothetical protein